MPVFKRFKKTKSTPRLVLIGSFGAGNIGDELILAGFLKLLTNAEERKSAEALHSKTRWSEGGLRELKNRIPKSNLTVLGGSPQKINAWHGVESLPLLPCGIRSLFTKNWLKTIQAIKKSDAVIFPGGGLFTDSENWRAVLLWGIHILIASYFWKPVYLLGQSIGPFKNKFSRKFTSFCLRKAEIISTRDKASINELKKLGVTQSKTKLGNDSAFYLTGKTPKTKSIKKTGLKILISVRDFPRLTSSFFQELAKTLDLLAEQKRAKITFTAFGSGDEKVWRKICRQSKKSKQWKEISLPQNPVKILAIIKKFDLVIGMRLHSLITAYLSGVPSIGISYSPKVAEFQKSIGKSKFVLNIKNFQAEELIKLLSV